jgi:hypothetical protein
MRTGSGDDPLDAWIDEATRQCAERGYRGPIFERMRRKHGTVGAMERIVKTTDIQSGFVRLKELGILQWSIEEGVCRFADRFTSEALVYAQFRLEHPDDPILRIR